MNTPDLDVVQVPGRASPWKVEVPASMAEDGKRQRRFFSTKVEADGFILSLKAQRRNYGRSASILPPAKADDAALAFKLLEDEGVADVTLQAMARAYLAARRAQRASKPLAEAFSAFIVASKRSDIYQAELQSSLRKLEPLWQKMVCDVSADDLNSVLTDASGTYRNRRLREWRAVFAFSIKRGWCEVSPIARMDFFKHRLGEREIYTVSHAAALLETAERTNLDLLPVIAIGLFSGIRVFELIRLEWSHVDLVEGSIDLPAAITKRQRRRSVPIEPSLRAWLERFIEAKGIQSGTVSRWTTYSALRAPLRALSVAAGVKWNQNAMRHSYASYWLAEHGDLNQLALYLGHAGGLEVLHQHYHRSVKKADAAKYWKSAPSAARKVLAMTA